MASLIADLLDRVQQLSDRVDSAHRARALNALDEAVQWYGMRLPMDSLMRLEDFISDGSRDMVLPDRVNKVIRVGDRTNVHDLDGGEHWGKRTPGQYFQNTTGQALEWRDMGYVSVIKQPATDTTLAIESTVSETMDVLVRGLVRDTTASGTALELFEAQETVQLGGASVNTANLFVEIKTIQKPKATTADVKITNNQTGLQVSRIPSWETRPRFPRIQIHFVPTSGTIFEVQYYQRPDRLTSEDDAIEPAFNEEAIMWRAVGNMHWIDNEDQAADRAWNQANEIISGIRNMEETFGEKDLHVEPWDGYLNLEELGFSFGDGGPW